MRPGTKSWPDVLQGSEWMFAGPAPCLVRTLRSYGGAFAQARADQSVELAAEGFACHDIGRIDDSAMACQEAFQQRQKLIALPCRQGSQRVVVRAFRCGLEVDQQLLAGAGQAQVHAPVVLVVYGTRDQTALREQLHHQPCRRAVDSYQTPDGKLVDSRELAQCAQRTVLRRGYAEIPAVFDEQRRSNLMASFQQEAGAAIKVIQSGFHD